jgi:hypothetical protein
LRNNPPAPPFSKGELPTHFEKEPKRVWDVMLNLFLSRINFGKTLKQVQGDRKKTFDLAKKVINGLRKEG